MDFCNVCAEAIIETLYLTIEQKNEAMKLNHSLILLFFVGLFASCSVQNYTSDNEPNRKRQKSHDPGAWDVDENGEVPFEEEVVVVEKEPYYGVNFQKSELLRPLLDQAKREGKLVFVDFYATWCGPCKAMDRNVFADPKVGTFFNENFINYKVDADGKGSHIAAIYDIKSLPTLLFLDTDGEVLARQNSAAGISELKNLAEKAQQLNRTSASRGGE